MFFFLIGLSSLACSYRGSYQGSVWNIYESACFIYYTEAIVENLSGKEKGRYMEMHLPCWTSPACHSGEESIDWACFSGKHAVPIKDGEQTLASHSSAGLHYRKQPLPCHIHGHHLLPTLLYLWPSIMCALHWKHNQIINWQVCWKTEAPLASHPHSSWDSGRKPTINPNIQLQHLRRQG